MVIAQPGQAIPVGRNALYAEWYGNGVYYSLNYERIFYSRNNNRLHLGARMGAMAYPNVFSNKDIIFIIPAEVNAILGKSEHKIELGIGNSVSTARFYLLLSDPQRYYRQFILFTRLGYRYYYGKGILCRLALMPLLTYKLGYISGEDSPGPEILKPSTSGLINDNSLSRFSLGISVGLTFGYSF